MPFLSVYTPKYMKIDYWVVGLTQRVFQILILFYIIWDLSVKQAWACVVLSPNASSRAARSVPHACRRAPRVLPRDRRFFRGARLTARGHGARGVHAATRRLRWALSTRMQAEAPTTTA
jgi:hypothetical protein